MVREERPRMRRCPNTFVFSVSLTFPHERETRDGSLRITTRAELAALRTCTTALMMTTLQTVSVGHSVCSNGQHARLAPHKKTELPHDEPNPSRQKKFRAKNRCDKRATRKDKCAAHSS